MPDLANQVVLSETNIAMTAYRQPDDLQDSSFRKKSPENGHEDGKSFAAGRAVMKF